MSDCAGAEKKGAPFQAHPGRLFLPGKTGLVGLLHFRFVLVVAQLLSGLGPVAVG